LVFQAVQSPLQRSEMFLKRWLFFPSLQFG
jgi:hypothetical protein